MEPNKPKRKMRKRSNIEGNNLKEILKAKQMSQAELCYLCYPNKPGFYSHLSLIVNGKKKQISLVIALRIAEVLGMKVEDVFVKKSPNTKK